MSTAETRSPATLPPRAALFLPASNPRAIEKARTLAVDMLILDLEDAVKPEDKGAARAAAVAAAGSFGDRPVAIRINGEDTPWFAEDLRAVAASGASHVVLPKAERAATIAQVHAATRRPVLAMIESPAAVLAIAPLVEAEGLCGLIAGTNDLALSLGLPPGAPRTAMAMALQTIVLAARARGLWAIDGVFNALDDEAGLIAEARAGRLLGFDGKAVIHPAQIAGATGAFGPDAAEVEDARALIAAATGGAERFRGRMIEALHVAQAERIVARAARG
ncbi:HpcH/HpaI aldolase/citrate lyase family protein [Sphingomonas baiyangensis]|uniref:CoA ester lyase n=1 Tax=Sphingomonas baiyangensis TaxID=2572576 RepID=A0A4U1L1Y1_9SPHN|nr:CoA ester lyase [Sphingomonas baiyangensis]TKD50877.1 CoA ester lyase [Sphingomonas baiyangensis]